MMGPSWLRRVTCCQQQATHLPRRLSLRKFSQLLDSRPPSCQAGRSLSQLTGSSLTTISCPAVRSLSQLTRSSWKPSCQAVRSLSQLTGSSWTTVSCQAGRSLSQLIGNHNSRDQFNNTARSLYKLGEMRQLSGETLTNAYHHFREVKGGRHYFHEEPPPSERVAEFLEISGMIAEYGTPEMADQMSGAIYMHASLTEDSACGWPRVPFPTSPSWI